MNYFAGFKSSKFVKSRLQAALYYARKKNRDTRALNPDTSSTSPSEEAQASNPPPPETP